MMVSIKIWVMLLVTMFLVVRVEFTRLEYTATEVSGQLPVRVILSGGRPSGPFNVSVIPSESFPTSAIGQ